MTKTQEKKKKYVLSFVKKFYFEGFDSRVYIKKLKKNNNIQKYLLKSLNVLAIKAYLYTI